MQTTPRKGRGVCDKAWLACQTPLKLRKTNAVNWEYWAIFQPVSLPACFTTAGFIRHHRPGSTLTEHWGPCRGLGKPPRTVGGTRPSISENGIRHLSDLHLSVPSYLIKDKRQEFKDMNWKSKALVAPPTYYGLRKFIEVLCESVFPSPKWCKSALTILQSQIWKVPTKASFLMY